MMPFTPVPPATFPVDQETFDAGMLAPLGGVNVAASAWTLTRRTFPSPRLALEKRIVAGLVPPLVLHVTSVTAKLTPDGTSMLTVCWAAAVPAVAAQAATANVAIRAAVLKVNRIRPIIESLA
jgi:hypothetical protein